MGAFQKEDGKWYFRLEHTCNPYTQRYDLPMEFGPYNDKDKADSDDAAAEAMCC